MLVAKRLRQSELGWFEACRLAGRETARQRALNLDSDIVRAIFAPGDNDVQIDVQERWWDGERLVDDRRPIKLQQKNWRLAGNAVTGARFDTVQPDDIVLMLFEQSAPAALWSLTWDVLSQVERATASVFEMARDVLGGHSSVCVPADVQASLLAAARRRLGECHRLAARSPDNPQDAHNAARRA